MTIAAIIPARGGSKSIRLKNLQEVGGVPLVEWSINAANASRRVGEVHVSTDDRRIVDVVRGKARVINRPSHLAQDHTPTPPVLEHAIRSLDPMPDIVVMLQCTTPFVTGEDIDAAVDMLIKDARADMVVSVCEDHQFQLRPSANGIQWLTSDRNCKETRRQDVVQTYRLNGGIHIYRTEQYLKAPWSHYGRELLYVMPEERSIDIDTPHDLRMARATAEYITAGEL